MFKIINHMNVLSRMARRQFSINNFVQVANLLHLSANTNSCSAGIKIYFN